MYDSSSYPLCESTAEVIASIIHSETQWLKFNFMNVTTGKLWCLSYCLCIYDLCSGLDPCLVEYDQGCIRMQLVRCIENCQFTRFPIKRQCLRTCRVSNVKTVRLCWECHMPAGLTCITCVCVWVNQVL